MRTIELKASAKINLSIDVLGKRADGYHEVVMVMQQIDLWDKVRISYGAGEHGITIDSNNPSLPKDGMNLAYKAAALFTQYYFENKGNICIYIDKKIPMGAGLGGGSADAAAVFHGLNLLWGLNLPISRLMELGVRVGADVPFLIMSQAASNPKLFSGLESDPKSSQKLGLSTCALAEGIGEKLTPLPPLKAAVLLKKPDLHISTAEIYNALEVGKIRKRPNTQALIEGLCQGNFKQVSSSMYNVLEEVAVKKYSIIQKTIDDLKKLTGLESIMMSGSGPTVFAMVDASSFSRE